MSIRVNCACGRALSVKDEHAGRKVRCPACQAVVPVPEAAASPDVRPDEPEDRRAGLRSEPPPRTRPALGDGDAEDRPRRRPRGEEEQDEPPRRRRAEEDEDRPRRARLDDDEDRPRKRRIKKDVPVSGESPMKAILGGIACMVGAVVWFGVGLALDRLFFYPPILFVLGIVAVCRGVYQANH